MLGKQNQGGNTLSLKTTQSLTGDFCNSKLASTYEVLTEKVRTDLSLREDVGTEGDFR